MNKCDSHADALLHTVFTKANKKQKQNKAKKAKKQQSISSSKSHRNVIFQFVF